MPVLPFLLAWIPSLAVAAAVAWQGPWLALPPALVWLIVPLADHFGGEETRWGDEAVPRPRWPYRLLVAVWVPVQLGLTVWGLSVATSGAVDGWTAALIVVDLGILGGATGITFAHELMHRTALEDRFLAELLMTSVSYPWFCVEHVHGHHRHVSTPEDPATSRLGESLYAFVPRTVVGGLRSALRFERKQLAKHGRPWWHPRSRIARQLVTLSALYGLAALAWGWPGVVAVLGMSAVAVFLLETINYIEHYGMLRNRVVGPAGRERYERVQPHHSWNSGHRVSNFMLINLARHSDHHAHAARPWERLRHLADAPQLPTGYGAMVLLAFVPPLWFKVMNPRVAAWRLRYSDGPAAPDTASSSAGVGSPTAGGHVSPPMGVGSQPA